jgi:hypothetical protein
VVPCVLHKIDLNTGSTHLKDVLKLSKAFFRVTLDDVSHLSFERGLLVKWGPLQKPKIAIQVVHTVLNGCATQNPSVGRRERPGSLCNTCAGIFNDLPLIKHNSMPAYTEQKPILPVLTSLSNLNRCRQEKLILGLDNSYMTVFFCCKIKLFQHQGQSQLNSGYSALK